MNVGLSIQRSTSTELSVYADADWAGCPDDQRSTGGYAVFYCPNLVWSSRKQLTVSSSSTKAKYKAIANGTAEATWFRSVLGELGIFEAQALVLWCDNRSNFPRSFVREKVAGRALKVRFVSSQDQLADIFTNALGREVFDRLRNSLNLVSTRWDREGLLKEVSCDMSDIRSSSL
jgi:hypothetical protein